MEILKPSHKEARIRGGTFSAHTAPIYLHVVLIIEYEVVLSVKINLRKTEITFDNTLSPGLARLWRNPLIASIPSSFGIFVYKDLTSIVTKIFSFPESSGCASIILMNAVVS